MKRQYRIYVNGRFQFAVSTADSPELLADRAAEAMRLDNNYKANFSVGQINFTFA